VPKKASPFPELRRRLERAEDRAQPFQAEGLPIPTAQFLSDFEEAVRAGDEERALHRPCRRDSIEQRMISTRASDQSSMWLTMPSASLGSNQVDFGGMIAPASATAIRSLIAVG